MKDILEYELKCCNGPKGAPKGDPVLSVRDHVSFATEAGRVDAVRGVSFDIWSGRTFAIVGESGSGKSITALSVIGLLDDNASVSGSIKLQGRSCSPRAMRRCPPSEGRASPWCSRTRCPP